jgi:hypothetical protein
MESFLFFLLNLFLLSTISSTSSPPPLSLAFSIDVGGQEVLLDPAGRESVEASSSSKRPRW